MMFFTKVAVFSTVPPKTASGYLTKRSEGDMCAAKGNRADFKSQL